MIKTKFISNCTKNDLDAIKIASLYFDKVEIVNNVLYHIEPVAEEEQNEEKTIGIIKDITEFVQDDYKAHIKLLSDEGIVDIISGEDKSKDELWNTIDKTTNEILSSEVEILFKEFDIKKDNEGKKISSRLSISDEAKLIHSEFVGPLESGSKLDIGFIIQYYSGLLSSLLLHISNGEQCLTSSDILNNFLRFYANNNKVNTLYKELKQEDVNPNLIMNAIKLAVPNISKFPFDEILETRERANSELLEFRDELQTFQFNLQENYSLAEINFKASDIVKHKVNPSLIDLKRKIEGLNLSLPGTILEQFKEPKSYTPLLGTLVGGIPAH
ncbi:MAG: hypothetical protein GYB35_16725, partial [Algicola sp.]|nr:hypothetical protein [Algicola sp.]